MTDDELPEMSPRLAETLELFDILSHTMFAVAPTQIGTVDLHDLPGMVRAVAVERADLKVQNMKRAGILLHLVSLLGDAPIRTEEGLPEAVAGLIAERDDLRESYVELVHEHVGVEFERDRLRAERAEKRDAAVTDVLDSHAEVVNALGDHFAGSLTEGVRRLRAERDGWFRDVEQIAAELEGEVDADGPTHVQLTDLVRGVRDERDRLRAALRAVMAETGTSSLAHHYARDALDGSADMGAADSWDAAAGEKP